MVNDDTTVFAVGAIADPTPSVIVAAVEDVTLKHILTIRSYPVVFWTEVPAVNDVPNAVVAVAELTGAVTILEDSFVAVGELIVTLPLPAVIVTELADVLLPIVIITHSIRY